MVYPYRRYHRHLQAAGGQHVGGVPGPAQTRLDHGNVHRGLLKVLEGQGGEHLKVGQPPALLRLPRLYFRGVARHQGIQRGGGDGDGVYADALMQGCDVRAAQQRRCEAVSTHGA